jgi:predicted nucleotidyltransferase component of viral defense system
MTDRSINNIAASVHARLLNMSHQTGEDFAFLLQRYAAERFLYRLGESPHRNILVLKGAMLFPLWGGSTFRSTHDLDFNSYGRNEIVSAMNICREICRVPVVNDGLFFDETTIKAEPIRDETDYKGFRIRFLARLGKSRIAMQIDIGFGNAIEPPATDAQYPTLLKSPRPEIRAYSREAVIAEKLHAMVVLGDHNSRMKDFYDLHSLAQGFSFDRIRLTRSIEATFKRRHTPIAITLPVALTPRFFVDNYRSTQWRRYLERIHLTGAPSDFNVVGELLISFLRPIWDNLQQQQQSRGMWAAGGPWSLRTTRRKEPTKIDK